jgi:uncharacterized protein (DUF427 family)
MSEVLEEKVLIAGVEGPYRSDAVRIERTERRVRTYFAGHLIADSKRVLLVYEPRRLPVYWFPVQDVRMDYLKPAQRTLEGDDSATTARWDLELEGRSAENAAWSYPHPDPERAGLRDHIAIYWNKMDAWYEEDDEVFVHPRDPYHRVDVLNSSRHVKVVVDGEVLAETRRPRLLFETGLPTRYYIPKLDVRMELLEATEKITSCPYKGRASYWSARVGDRLLEDLVWSYPAPIPECPKIENLLSFYNEKVDIYVDGELQPRPRTQWS